MERPGDRVAELGRALPDADITVCHRSDESGTTKNFTQFLADYSPAWEKGPGVDKTVKWPTGTGAKGNDGVAACIKQNQNSIGYVEQAYALQNNFTFADVKNKAGQYITPTLEATSAAGEGCRSARGSALQHDQRRGRRDVPDRGRHVHARPRRTSARAGSPRTRRRR